MLTEAREKEVKLPSLKTRVQWFEDWEEATRDNRALARRDRQYYDNIQLTREELDTLKERGQPPIIKNRIARKVNFTLGEEIKKRINPAARPRTPQHEDGARSMTDALRFAADEEHFDEVRSSIFKSILIEGYGGALKEMEDDGDGDYKHKWTALEWDRLAYDEHSRAPDYSDAIWLAIVKWMDLEDAIESMPDAADGLRQITANRSSITPIEDTTEDSPRNWISGDRKRVQFVEMFFRVGQDWYRSVFTEGLDIEPPAKTWLLDEKRRHTLCPLVMESCYVDADGNRYGIVRQLVSPQDMVNKTASKTLHALNVNQVIAETDVVTDPNAFQEELAKPDGFATGIRPNALKDGSIQIRSGMQLAEGHVAFMQAAIADIDGIGPAAANMPELPNSASGVAFKERRQSAAQELGTLFDQLRSMQRRMFGIDWLGIRHPDYGWKDEKWLRVTDDAEDNGYRFTPINRPMTRAQRFMDLLNQVPPVQPQKALEIAAGNLAPVIVGQVTSMMQPPPQQGAMTAPGQGPNPQAVVSAIMQHPMMQEQITVNQVDQMSIDIILDEAPDTATLAEEQFASLSEFAQPLVQMRPDLAPMVAKWLIRSSSLPEKREMMQELNKGPDPQQQQMAQQQQAMAQQMTQLQMALQQATIAVEQTKAQLQQAQVEKTAAETAKIAVETKIAPAQAQANIENVRSQAISHAADAGAKTAGVMPTNNSGEMPQENMQ